MKTLKVQRVTLETLKEYKNLCKTESEKERLSKTIIATIPSECKTDVEFLTLNYHKDTEFLNDNRSKLLSRRFQKDSSEHLPNTLFKAYILRLLKNKIKAEYFSSEERSDLNSIFEIEASNDVMFVISLNNALDNYYKETKVVKRDLGLGYEKLKRIALNAGEGIVLSQLNCDLKIHKEMKTINQINNYLNIKSLNLLCKESEKEIMSFFQVLNNSTSVIGLNNKDKPLGLIFVKALTQKGKNEVNYFRKDEEGNITIVKSSEIARNVVLKEKLKKLYDAQVVKTKTMELLQSNNQFLFKCSKMFSKREILSNKENQVETSYEYSSLREMMQRYEKEISTMKQSFCFYTKESFSHDRKKAYTLLEETKHLLPSFNPDIFVELVVEEKLSNEDKCSLVTFEIEPELFNINYGCILFDGEMTENNNLTTLAIESDSNTSAQTTKSVVIVDGKLLKVTNSNFDTDEIGNVLFSRGDLISMKKAF